jgi:hypothetical protein
MGKESVLSGVEQLRPMGGCFVKEQISNVNIWNGVCFVLKVFHEEGEVLPDVVENLVEIHSLLVFKNGNVEDVRLHRNRGFDNFFRKHIKHVLQK